MARIKSILMVNNDEDLCGAITEQFLATGEFTVEWAFCDKEALQYLYSNDFDAIIIDTNLPSKGVPELCAIIRKQDVNCPIIMVTDDTGISGAISGFDGSAIEYVRKPFKFSVLLAQIRSQLRQLSQIEDVNLAFGPYLFSPAQKYLMKHDGQKIRLTDKETSILKLLLQAECALVQRDVLLHKVWGYNPDITTHTLETHIYRLRQKIEQDPANSRFLVTEAGGYKIVA